MIFCVKTNKKMRYKKNAVTFVTAFFMAEKEGFELLVLTLFSFKVSIIAI